MAISAGEIEVILSAQTRKFVAEMKKSQTATDKLAKTALKLGKVLAAIAVAKKVARAIDNIGRAAGTQQRALNDLESALRRAGVDAPSDATKEFAGFAAQLQKVTTIGDEAAIQAAAIGASFGITGDELKKTTSLAADMSRVLGTDLKAAMILLGKAAKGNISSLTRYGVVIDEDVPKAEQFNAVLGELDKLFGGAAQSTDDYVSKTKQLGNAWGDLQETLGDSDFLLDIVDNLKETVVFWDQYIKRVKSAGAVSGEFSKVSRAQKDDLAKLRAELTKNENEMFRLTSTMENWSGEAQKLRKEAVQKLSEEQVKLTKEIRFTEEALREQVVVITETEVKQAKLKKAHEDAAAAAKAQAEAEKELADSIKSVGFFSIEAAFAEGERIRIIQDGNEARVKQLEQEEEAVQKANETAAAIGDLGASFIGAAASAARGEQTFQEAIKESIRALAAAAAAATAKFVFAAVPPPASFALAPIAGAAAFAAINQLANFHQGGIVRQSELLRLPGMGADEGIAILRANERVLTPQQRASGADAAGGAGDVNIVMQLVSPPTRADVDRSIRTAIVPALRRLRRKGAF